VWTPQTYSPAIGCAPRGLSSQHALSWGRTHAIRAGHPGPGSGGRPFIWLPPLCHPEPTRAALAYIDVFVDDFLALRQGTPQDLCQSRRHIFHMLDLLFHRNGASNRHRKTPSPVKKLRFGDANWTARKKLLGWVAVLSPSRQSATKKSATCSLTFHARPIDVPSSPGRSSAVTSAASPPCSPEAWAFSPASMPL
jgi:hypothetical protein